MGLINRFVGNNIESSNNGDYEYYFSRMGDAHIQSIDPTPSGKAKFTYVFATVNSINLFDVTDTADVIEIDDSTNTSLTVGQLFVNNWPIPVDKRIGYSQVGYSAIGRLLTQPIILGDHITDAGNSGSSETDLYSDTLAADLLRFDGDKIVAFYSLVVSASTAPTIRVKLAGTARFDRAVTAGSTTENWQLKVVLMRTGSSTARISTSLLAPAAAPDVYSAEADISFDPGLSNVLKITATGTASNQVVAKHGYVAFVPQ